MSSSLSAPVGAHGFATGRVRRGGRLRRWQRRRRRWWLRTLAIAAALVLAAALALAAVLVCVAGSVLPVAGLQQRQPAPDPPAAGPFRPPVDAPITDGWRPPTSPYAPGNRGWEYATTADAVVRSAGAGTVTFAGPVGGSRAVTVAHRGGIRTSYTHLRTITVRVGDRVGAGSAVGTAGERLHFGVRLRDAYVDPDVLFRPGALRYGARLLPHAGRRGRSATLPRRSAPQAVPAAPAVRVHRHLAPGPPTVATRAGPGTSNRWEGARRWPSSP